MLSISCVHPEAEDFINAKLEQGKVTGANISVKITNEFMDCVMNNKKFIQYFPVYKPKDEIVPDDIDYNDIDVLKPGKLDKSCYKVIDAKKFWNKIIHNAWRSAEPGVLFWDNILDNTSSKPYYGKGFKPISTNPCGEIPLQSGDSCRLLHMNSYSFVENPFTPNSRINWVKLEEMTRLATRMLDDIVDIELEKVSRIIDKIKSDPEDESIKRTEIELWEKIYKTGKEGRRLGLGTTADGDMVAAMGLKYGTEDANDLLEKFHKYISMCSYMESIDLAVDRGPFEIFDWSLEKDDYFINKILNAVREEFGDDMYYDYYEKWKLYGRRNICNLTLAPTGSTSCMTQTSSGFEPVFALFYQRKRKIEDKSKADFVDEVGDAYEINNVVHHKFIDWFISYTTENKTNPDLIPHTHETAKEYLSKLSEDKLNELIKLSPYHGATANEIDPVMKSKLQGRIQNWIDNSISCTVNMRSDVTEELVNKVYFEAFKSGCKGITIYRDGCRSGVLTTSSSTDTKQCESTPSRPDELDAEVVRFKNNDEYWIAYVGIRDGKPYEIFTGPEDKDERILPKSIKKGKLVRVIDKKGKKRYDFRYIESKYGYENTVGGISHMFNRVYWNYAKLISGYLRNNVPIADTLNVLEGLSFDKESINTWKNGVIRALKKFVANGTKSKSKCPECGESLVYEEGCLKCPNCGYSKCGG